MSYILQFPTSLLPPNARSPPYVLFGLNGEDAFEELPPHIPLTLALHYIPKLRAWVLPAPELPHAAIWLALRTPIVGINILGDLDIVGLTWILTRMFQCAGSPVDKDMFHTKPDLLTSISIHKAWLALDLPLSGISGLHTHILTLLMLGDPVSMLEIKALWHTFPITSPILHQMGLNFIRSHINIDYTHSEFSAIRHWYLETRGRCRFFKSLEAQFPEFHQVQTAVIKTVGDRARAAKSKSDEEKSSPKGAEIMEKYRTRRVSTKERKTRETGDRLALKKRLQRVRSDESLRSVETTLWNPEIEENTTNSTTSFECSRPVHGPTLLQMLQDLVVEKERQETIVERGMEITHQTSEGTTYQRQGT